MNPYLKGLYLTMDIFRPFRYYLGSQVRVDRINIAEIYDKQDKLKTRNIYRLYDERLMNTILWESLD